jgi:hypothetical protein
MLISTSKNPWSFLLLLIYSLYNKIRDNGKIVSVGIEGMGEREGVRCGIREGLGGVMTQTLYVHMNKKIKNS